MFLIPLLWGTNPDSQLAKPFFKGFLLEDCLWVHFERYSHVFSRDNNSMNIFPIGWYMTVLVLHAWNAYICWLQTWDYFQWRKELFLSPSFGEWCRSMNHRSTTSYDIFSLDAFWKAARILKTFPGEFSLGWHHFW